MLKDNCKPKLYKTFHEEICNRHVNLVYMLAGVLQQAFEDMEKYLNFTQSGLRFENKRTLNDIRDLSKRFRRDVDALQEASFLKLDDDQQCSHEDAIHKVYTLLLRISEITGTKDEAFKIRMYLIYLRLKNNYHGEFIFPTRELQESMAFGEDIKNLNDGTYTQGMIDKAFEMDLKQDNNNERQA